MSTNSTLPSWHEDTGFQPDMSLFDGASDKIIGKPMPASRAATKGKTEAWQAISGVTGLGKTFQMRNPIDSIINDDDESGNPESGHPTMDLIISELPPKPTHRIVPSGLPPRPPSPPISEVRREFRERMRRELNEQMQRAPEERMQEMEPMGGASRKMRRSRKTKKSRRARRVKTQMRRKNSSRKSTRRRTRK
jgi:hypothetical protein